MEPSQSQEEEYALCDIEAQLDDLLEKHNAHTRELRVLRTKLEKARKQDVKAFALRERCDKEDAKAFEALRELHDLVCKVKSAPKLRVVK